MAEPVRLRLEFEDRHLLTKSQRSEGLRRCWALLRPDLATIGDLADCFALQRSCPHGLVLSLDEFVLPSFESTCIFKDKDIIRRKKIKLTSPEMPITTTAQDEHVQAEQNRSSACKKDDRKSLVRTAKLSNGDGSSDTPIAPQHNVGVRKKTSSVPTEKRSTVARTFFGGVATQSLAKSRRRWQVTGGAALRRVGPWGERPVVAGALSGTAAAGRCRVGFAGFGLRDFGGEGYGGVSQFPSRTARRKKAKRLERRKMREMASHQMEKDMQSLVPPNDIDGTSAKHQAVDEITEVEDEIVPVMVRPGHIRFEPLDAEQSKLQSNGPVETLQWNGTTSKKKGQKWGREKTLSRNNEDNSSTGASNGKTVAEEGKHVDGHIDFESLYPLTRLPEEGDVLVYRLVELSSSWCPELSPFRVGKVSSYDSISKKIVLVPVSEYPLFSNEKNDPEESSQQPDISHYKEDGSLEIEYPSLLDVRLLKPNESETENVHNLQGERTVVAAPLNNWGVSLAKSNAAKSVTPLAETRPDMGWEQIEQALTEKKAELRQNNG